MNLWIDHCLQMDVSMDWRLGDFGEKESFMAFNVFSIVCWIGFNKWQIQMRWAVIWLKFIMHLAMHIHRGQ